MRPVQAPAGLSAAPAARPFPARRALLAALLALAVAGGILALALSSGGGGSAESRPATGAVIGTVPLQRARCADWVGASGAERDATSRALSTSVGGPTGYGPGSTLTSAQAERLFDGTCARSYTSGWLLYELYIRAAGFRSYLG